MSALTSVHDCAVRPVEPGVHVQALREIADRIWIGTRRYVAVRQYRRDLERMPDWALRDIGIARDEIAWVVDENLDQSGRPRGPFLR